jgi:hypothetical protein
MIKRLGLSAMQRTTQYAPLAALGYLLRQQDFFAPLREHVQLGCKAVLHESHEKLLDLVVRMLADCAALKQINTRLRPDTALATAWGRDRFAGQSTIARVLDAFTPVSVAQLRTASAQIYGRTGQAVHHAFDQELLFLDIDLTGLPAGRRAEASTKGYFSGEKTAAGASSPGSAPHNTLRAWSPCSIPAARLAKPVYTPQWPPWSGCWA